MTTKKKIYTVDESVFDDYVKSVNDREVIMVSIVFLLAIGFFVFYLNDTDPSFPIITYMVIAGIAMVGAFFFGQSIRTEILMKFKHASFEITPTTIEIHRPNIETRMIPIKDIGIIDKSFKGTLLKEGFFGTDPFHYISRRRNKLDLEDRIFIPKVTKDYDELIQRIKMQVQEQRMLNQ